MSVKEAWRAAGDQLGLDANAGGLFAKPQIRGFVGDVSVVVVVDTPPRIHPGEFRLGYTSYTVTHRAAGPPMRISRQGSFAKVSKWFRKRDVEVGDPHFDDQVIVDSGEPEQVRAYLTPSRRAAILAIFNGWVEASMTQNEINILALGVARDASTIVDTVTQLVGIAQVMSEPAEVDAALGLQQQGRLGDAIEELHAINDRNPNAFTQMLEAQALVEHGDHKGAAEILAPASLESPGGGERDAWKRLAATAAPVPRSGSVEDAPSVSNLTVRHVIDDLFGGQLASFDVIEKFEKQYVNQLVSWSGDVINVQPYRTDSDFGDGPGLKVVVLLGTAGGSTVISNEVHAVLQLPADTQVERNERISFSGRLMHADVFARMLYISSGTVV